MKKKVDFRENWVLRPALILNICLTLNKLLHFLRLQFLHMQIEEMTLDDSKVTSGSNVLWMPYLYIRSSGKSIPWSDCPQFTSLGNDHSCEMDLLLVCLNIFNVERVCVHVYIPLSGVCVCVGVIRRFEILKVTR